MVLASLLSVARDVGYPVLFLLVAIETMGIPVPGETAIFTAGILASRDELQIEAVIVIAAAGAIIGDNIGFAIGHFGGRPLVNRYGRYIFLTPARVDRATGFFERHGGWIIVVARFIEGLRQANGIIAGVSGIHWARFLLFNAIGAGLWVAVWTCIGYFSGSHVNAIYHTATRYSTYIAVAVGVLVLAYIALHVVRSRRARSPNTT